jgi:hypothetical protein
MWEFEKTKSVTLIVQFANRALKSASRLTVWELVESDLPKAAEPPHTSLRGRPGSNTAAMQLYVLLN